MRTSSRTIGRLAALAAVVIGVVAVVVVLFGTGGDDYTYKARFINAAQLVKGDQIADRRHRRRVDQGHRADRRRPGRDHHLDRPPATGRCATAPRRSSARPRCRASPTATSTCSPGRVRRRRSRRARSWAPTTPPRRSTSTSSSTSSTRDAQVAAPAHPRLRRHVRRAQQGRQRRLAVPQPGPGRVGAPVRGAQPRHRPCCAHFVVANVAAGHRRRRPPQDLAGLVDHLATTTTRDRQPAAPRCRTRSSRCPRSCARPTRPSSTCAPRSTTSSRWSTSPSRWPRSCARSCTQLRPLALDARPTRARPLAARSSSAGKSNDLIELTNSLGPARDSAIGPVQAQRQAARRRVPRLDQGPERVDARARLRAALRGRPDRLVRRLLHSRRLRRAGRRQPRRPRTSTPPTNIDGYLPSVPLKDAARRAARRRRRRSASATAARARSSAAPVCKPTADFPCDESQVPLGPT